ncbi:uracil phosphoribosyltransferase [Phascolarctobacterium sp.]|uniref:uracil phosphoribosyltransferase n=1 Tax=Phascolarctobacterium sp. TaxID=2049039 RepID=UPI003863D53F
MQITVVDHPLLKAKMTRLRDINTDCATFRRTIGEVAMLLTFEAAAGIPMEECQVTTPLCETTGSRIHGTVNVIPILRAGLGFMEGVLTVLPEANVGHIGMSRNETTLEPMEYYCKLPKDLDAYTIVVDPMLATGGSAVAAVDQLKKRGLKNICFMCLVAAPEGVLKLNAAHPDVKIYAAALDDHLNEKGYIVPGLGDAGDRIFGTL